MLRKVYIHTQMCIYVFIYTYIECVNVLIKII